MIDWDQLVVVPLVEIFGEGDAGVTYYPAGGSAFDVNGVYDDAYREVRVVNGTAVTVEQPVLGVRVSQFAQKGLVLDETRQGDQLVVKRTGERLAVKEVRLDSHGHALLMLNLARGS